MSKVIRQSRWVENTSYELVYAYMDEPGAGFGFPCTADGTVEALNPDAQANYLKCVRNMHERPVICRGVKKLSARYRVPAAILCDCGRELELIDCMTNECDCGRFYNGSGQSLVHPRFWGEETGERFDDHGALIG